ncbi:MAG: polyamine aminopropyltransferase [Deinococcus sp.]|nr:polyamine aminopropyltransferase [Deinococcus sp.]
MAKDPWGSLKAGTVLELGGAKILVCDGQGDPKRDLYPIEEVLLEERSPYQEALVVRSRYWGHMLVLDGALQLAERDEHVYHEMLVHPALFLHPRPQRVVVIGGGDGGTLREVLKHPEVQKAYLVEIDDAVVKLAQRYFPQVIACLKDPRAELVIQDGLQFMAEASPGSFDVVIIDLTDPVGPAQALFQPPFYQSVRRALAKDGLLATQSEPLVFRRHLVRQVQESLLACFPSVDLYAAVLPTYGGNWWTFSLASTTPGANLREPVRTSPITTRLYRPDVHRWAFLPPSLVADVRSGTGDWW